MLEVLRGIKVGRFRSQASGVPDFMLDQLQNVEDLDRAAGVLEKMRALRKPNRQ